MTLPPHIRPTEARPTETRPTDAQHADAPTEHRARMFHVKHRTRAQQRSRTLLAVGATALALLLSACGSIAAPVGWAPPVAGPGGALLVQSGTGSLAAVNGAGSVIAQYTVEPPPVRGFLGRTSAGVAAPFYAAPVVDGAATYVVTYRGRVARLDLQSNAFAAVWTTDLERNVVATPVLRGGRLYVSAEDGTLVVLDAASGKQITASRPTEGRVWGSPALLDNRLFVGTLDSSQMLAVNADSGATEWTQRVAGATAADLVATQDTVIVPSFDRTMHALDAASGTERWRFTGNGWFVGRPLVTPDAIYATTLGGAIYALGRSGTLTWQAQQNGLEFRSAPVLVGNLLVVAARNGTILGLDAASGDVKWTKRAESATIDANGAAMSGGVFYITSTHQLLRVDPASGDIKSFDVQPPKSK